MIQPVRVVHYVNQFFAGIGGEEMAHVGISLASEVVGASRALQQALGTQGTLLGTIIGGDNYVSEQRAEAIAAITGHLQKLRPDVVMAGPAFNAGRYGLACAEVCKTAQALGLKAVTGMHPENPGTLSYPSELFIVPTAATSVDMPTALAAMVRLVLKLSRGEELGPAQVEGYLPRVTTGGLVRKGNPDKQVSSNTTRYYRHSVAELRSLSGNDWEAYHSGYFNHIVNSNPNYILPLNFLRDLEDEGTIGGVYEGIYALPGVSTPVAISKRLGRSIAEDLQAGGVNGCLLVAT